MYQETFVVRNKTGIHARPASEVVSTAKSFQSNVQIQSGEKLYNAKSIISLLSGGMKQNTQITVIADGKDEQAAGVAVATLIKGFTE